MSNKVTKKQCKLVKVKRHNDGPLQALSKIAQVLFPNISAVIKAHLENRKETNAILNGEIKEADVVRNISQNIIRFINARVFFGGLPPKLQVEVKNEQEEDKVVKAFENEVRKAKTVRDLERLYPNFPDLKRLAKLFDEAKKRNNKGLITHDSLSWTRMKMNNRLFICDGKFQNMVQSVKSRVGKMIERIKTDMTGLNGTNKAIYVLGMIFKSLSIIQAGKSSVEMVREAKKLKGYCTDVSEFMGAMNQSMEGQEQAVRETVAEATNKFGGESKGYAKKLTALNLIWKALKPALIWISGYTLQRAAVESKNMVPREEAPAQMVKTDSARRIRLDGKAKEKVKAIEQLNQKLPDTGKIGETKKRVKKSIQAIKDPKVPIDKKKLIIGGIITALAGIGLGLAANSISKSAARTAAAANQTANRMEQHARELRQMITYGSHAIELQNGETRAESINRVEREAHEWANQQNANAFLNSAMRIINRPNAPESELSWIITTSRHFPGNAQVQRVVSQANRRLESLARNLETMADYSRLVGEDEEDRRYQREVERRRAQRERERNAAIARTNGVGNANGIHRVQRAGEGFSEAGRYGGLDLDPNGRPNRGNRPFSESNRFRGLEMDKATVIRRARDSYYKAKRAHKDFFLAYALLAKGIGKYLSNEQLIRDILYGNIKEDNFVRNFINKYVNEIDYQVKNGGYAQEIIQEKQDFKNKLLRARTIKDLLRIFPNNPGLVRIDKMFMEARKRASR